jgi:hypothetical protein
MKEIKDSIVASVIEKYIDRSEAGIEKYGTTLERNLLTFNEWLTHLQEELMDATLYIEKIKKLGINNAKLYD